MARREAKKELVEWLETNMYVRHIDIFICIREFFNDDEDREVMNMDHVKEMLWFQADWPPFIDPGVSWLLNKATQQIRDADTIDFMKLVDRASSKYRYSKTRNGLVRRV